MAYRPVDEYLKLGWHVFPSHLAINGRCSCGKPACDNVGKHPRTANGLKDASRDGKQIARWWPRGVTNPSNVAVATGKHSRIVVVDIDPRHGGDETLAALESELGSLPRDWSVTTGGGGTHIYLTYPSDHEIKSRNRWRQGIDVKANGGYVIAPPSRHASGNRYEWRVRYQDSPPPIPPAWLKVLTEAAHAPPVDRTAATDARSLLLQRAQQYAASIPGAGEGSRNQAAFNLAGHLASFVADGVERLPEADILSVVQSWNARCEPPLSDRELETCVTSTLTNGTPRPDKLIDTSIEVSRDDEGHSDSASGSRKSQATLLVELADSADLFHDADGEAYARVPVGADDHLHCQLARVRTRPFKRWLAQRFYRTEGKVPSAQAMQDALGVVEAKAVFDGDQREVAIRVAEHDGRIYFDLCNQRWQVVEVDKLGWRILDDSPVMFRRSKAMMALPMPSGAGDIGQLRSFANVTDEDWPLVLAWLVGAMCPRGPYPVLAISGEHGSGKSGLCRRLRSLVDPNTSPLRGDYREPRDLMICANSGWVVALDNLSNIPAWLSDCFCRLATGGGFSCRKLYEDDEETIFEATRPLLLNCIDEVVTRSDLLDRCLLLSLPRIASTQRVPEKQLDREFEAARPQILGGLFSAVSMALRNEDLVQLTSLPRMADFAIWATAAEPALGLEPGQFMATYQANRSAGNDTAIEASPIGKALVDFVADVGTWTGTSTDLLRELEEWADDKTQRLKTWPTTPRRLGGDVKRLAPNLREAGIRVELVRSGKQRTRLIVLSRQEELTGNSASASSASSATHESSGKRQHAADARADETSAADAERMSADTKLIWADATTEDGKSAENGCFLEENCHADIADKADAIIPTHSREPEWCEL